MRAWPALLLAPLFALAAQIIAYALLTPACQQAKVWPIHATFLFFFLLCVATTIGAWLTFQRARIEFVPLASVWSGAFFCVVVLAQWAAMFFLSPCMHSP